MKTVLSGVAKQIEPAIYCLKFTKVVSQGGKNKIQYMQNKTVTTKHVMKYWRSGSFCIYFELGIFHYLIGVVLCIGIQMHVHVSLFTADFAVSCELGKKLVPLMALYHSYNFNAVTGIFKLGRI